MGESITHSGTEYNTFGRGFEGETGGVVATLDETLGLESPADGLEDCTTVRCTSSSCSSGTFLFDFRWVEMVSSKPNWKGGGAAAVEDHTSCFFDHKVARSVDA